MTPKHIGITGGPGEHELHRAHDNYKDRQSVTIWLLPDHDHDMYVRGLTHLREWSTDEDGQYLFSGRLIARHRDAGFAYFPKIEGEYDSHRRKGHLEVINDFRLVHVIGDDEDNFFLADAW